MKVSKEEKERAVEALKGLVSKGDKVYGIVRSVARSGKSRSIDFYVLGNNEPIYLSGHMSQALSISQDKRGALKVSGCGMNMIFACVYALSRALFGDGDSLKHDCL